MGGELNGGASIPGAAVPGLAVPGLGALLMATVTYSSAGTGSWLCPANVFTVTVACWGGGGGGANGTLTVGGGGGGGGEYASDTVTVTPGTLYTWQVGTAGKAGVVGGQSKFIGGSVGVVAHGGKGGTSGTGGAGGTGSSNATHFSGGAGANNISGFGGGGGSSAGTAANGNNGSGTSGGSAPSGGGAGGNGGFAGGVSGANGSAPGGGGGGGTSAAGGLGAPGQVQLTYTVATQPLVPFFPAGFAALPSDYNNWIQAPLSFLTSKVAFRAELTTGQAMSSGGTTVLAFNSILEDPFAGWQSGPSQWLCPAGMTATYEVAVTASCVQNPGNLRLQALAGLDSAATLYGLAAVTVPGTASTLGNGLASGAVPVQLYGGQDTVQGLAIVTGGAGTTVSTAGQRCELSIVYMNQ